MIDQERSSLRFAIMLLVTLLIILIAVDYLLRLNLIQGHITGIQILDQAIISFTVKSRSKLITIRAIFILAMIALSYLRHQILQGRV